MNMGMNLDEKIKRLVSIIDEAIIVQKTNPVYVPTLYFESQNLGFPSPRDVFRVLLENGAVKNLTKCWGYELIEKNNNRVFKKTSTDEPQNDDDFEVYEIAVDERKLRQYSSAKSTSSEEIDFDALNGVISYGKIRYAFQKGRQDQMRLKLFRELWEFRQVTQNKKTKRKGEALPPGAIASRIELVDSSQGFEKNKAAKEKLGALLKNIEGTLQRKKIPIRLYQKGGIQIVVDLK